MKTNLQVVTAFINGGYAESGSMWTDGYILKSYNTCIAERLPRDGGEFTEFIVSSTKYSVTTSKQQSLLNRALFNTSYVNVERTTKYVPIGTQCDLNRYL